MLWWLPVHKVQGFRWSSQLAEQKGNPLVHDILERLGLLDHDGTRDMRMELDMDKYDSDHEPSSDKASTTNSSQESQRGTETSPKPHYQEHSASPPLDPQQQFLLEADNPDHNVDLWNLQPRRSDINHFSPLPIQHQTELMLESPPSLEPWFPGVSSTAHSVEATDWTAVDSSATWWQGASQTPQTTPLSSDSSMPALSAPHMAAGNAMKVATYYPRSFLVDPGVYASDFDV
ncbi:hypothetical protein E4T50_11005 [Aureobasidium sp. EXF-12298]|nr:hypothetical protein E4T50_11005 [Aureobasidium sp. EXF-12298]KAI4753936.1 hypothetical protein E4T51_12947 [Aureobasidium sp. EXF-12344]KAI4781179.1 hypothetical protein E4T52_03889 [Aureobasidium sp. EXF-3400]